VFALYAYITDKGGDIAPPLRIKSKTKNIMNKLIVIGIITVLFAGFSSCGGDDPAPEKSRACEITSFKDGDRVWQVSDGNISAVYPKGSNVSAVAPVIEVSKGASVEPKSGAAQDFSSDKAVAYTVTAEDGVTTKTYTAKASVTAGN
jgi:hypothetical protein